jgi:hypothetical protein
LDEWWTSSPYVNLHSGRCARQFAIQTWRNDESIQGASRQFPNLVNRVTNGNIGGSGCECEVIGDDPPLSFELAPTFNSLGNVVLRQVCTVDVIDASLFGGTFRVPTFLQVTYPDDLGRILAVSTVFAGTVANVRPRLGDRVPLPNPCSREWPEFGPPGNTLNYGHPQFTASGELDYYPQNFPSSNFIRLTISGIGLDKWLTGIRIAPALDYFGLGQIQDINNGQVTCRVMARNRFNPVGLWNLDLPVSDQTQIPRFRGPFLSTIYNLWPLLLQQRDIQSTLAFSGTMKLSSSCGTFAGPDDYFPTYVSDVPFNAVGGNNIGGCDCSVLNHLGQPLGNLAVRKRPPTP